MCCLLLQMIGYSLTPFPRFIYRFIPRFDGLEHHSRYYDLCFAAGRIISYHVLFFDHYHELFQVFYSEAGRELPFRSVAARYILRSPLSLIAYLVSLSTVLASQPLFPIDYSDSYPLIVSFCCSRYRWWILSL